MSSAAVSYARENQKRFLDELKDLLRIPSVSTLDEHKPDIQKAADYVANELRRIGMEDVEVIPTKGHPLIYADWLDEQGGMANSDRAEFIRLQIELQDEDENPGDPASARKHARVHSLEKRYGKRWAAPLIGRLAPVPTQEPT